MQFDNIIIGSGLAACGAALAIPRSESVLVFAGPASGRMHYYDQRKSVPCAFDGFGGLGQSWHGVIPLRLFEAGTRQEQRAWLEQYQALFRKLYPRTKIENYLFENRIFIPWRPIRPTKVWKQVRARREGALEMLHANVAHFAVAANHADVTDTSGSRYACSRLWIAAGALGTPRLLEHSLNASVGSGHVSDHLLLYIGSVQGETPPASRYTPDGILLPASYSDDGAALYTLRPARFSFRSLDFGIEQRAAFGMPTGALLKKFSRRLSPGLLAEAIYLRTGVAGRPEYHSLYAQVRVGGAYTIGRSERPLEMRDDAIQQAAKIARAGVPYSRVRYSMREDLFIPGIHLHGSVSMQKLRSNGMNIAGGVAHVLDASIMEDIGAEHHSFKMMAMAFKTVASELALRR